MRRARPTWLSWSSGKDSAWTLHTLRRDPDAGCEVRALVTTVTPRFGRVSIHGVRIELLRAQAAAVGLPLEIVELPSPCSNLQYEEAMAALVARAECAGIECMAFGDLFLADIRRYRERMLGPTRIEPIFPIWGCSTRTLARQMVDAGLRAVLTCIDPTRLSPSFAGRVYDHALLADLPDAVDPCGENGEFHTFATAGPMFRGVIDVQVGECVERDGAIYADCLRVG